MHRDCLHTTTYVIIGPHHEYLIYCRACHRYLGTLPPQDERDHRKRRSSKPPSRRTARSVTSE